ncbi:TonB-dependent receptor domain-containing protein, partial [Marinovum sp. 1_MG-2023]
LTPEEAFNQDLGVEWAVGATTVSASLFSYKYKNLVDFDAGVFSLVNRSNISSKGAEIVVNSQVTEKLAMSASLTRVDIKHN